MEPIPPSHPTLSRSVALMDRMVDRNQPQSSGTPGQHRYAYQAERRQGDECIDGVGILPLLPCAFHVEGTVVQFSVAWFAGNVQTKNTTNINPNRPAAATAAQNGQACERLATANAALASMATTQSTPRKDQPE